MKLSKSTEYIVAALLLFLFGGLIEYAEASSSSFLLLPGSILILGGIYALYKRYKNPEWKDQAISTSGKVILIGMLLFALLGSGSILYYTGMTYVDYANDKPAERWYNQSGGSYRAVEGFYQVPNAQYDDKFSDDVVVFLNRNTSDVILVSKYNLPDLTTSKEFMIEGNRIIKQSGTVSGEKRTSYAIQFIFDQGKNTRDTFILMSKNQIENPLRQEFNSTVTEYVREYYN